MVSVSTKLFVLVVSALILLSLGISVLSMSRLDQEFEQYQTAKLNQGLEQYEQQTRILRQQTRVWLESFSELINLRQKSDFSSAIKALEDQYDMLQINQSVEQVWLISENFDLLYGSSNLPEYARDSANRAFERNSPDYLLFCTYQCQQLVSVPLLNAKGDVAVVTMAISFIDVIFSIQQTLNNNVAVIGVDSLTNQSIKDAQIITASVSNLTREILQQKEAEMLLTQAYSNGLQIIVEDHSYLINLLPMASSTTQDFYMMQIDDVSSFTEKYEQHRFQFLLSALLIFSVVALFVQFIAGPTTKRLLTLASALPLLAKREFEQFRAVKMKKSKLFHDEIDAVINATTDLSYELEQLNIEVVQKTKELENIAMYDLLTGLPNRNMLNYQLRKSLSALNDDKTLLGILFLDLDDFKKVNDIYGHGDGDRLLVEAAKRLKLSVRPVDMVCRFGGDEFVILLGKLDSIECAESVARNILHSFQQPINIDSNVFYVTSSIGIGVTDSILTQSSELISQADIAMYEAKENGGDQYYVYHGDMYQRVAHRVMMEGEVKQALAKGQFSLSLQPQLVAKNNRLHGFEALLRWQHPERGMVSPDDFIPILENSEHMIELGYWVIRRCFELSVRMRTIGLKDTIIAINLSAAQFADVKLPEYLISLLAEFDLPAQSFELELTEQTLVKDMDKAIETMDALRQLGFSFAIDDFGTGYSSLAYLKRMPVDVIKIDKSFVFGMLENHADFQIITSTIAMVKNLGLTVIAEGVETQAQLRSLIDNDCDLIQGYYFSKPIPEDELFDFISRQIVDGSWKVAAPIKVAFN